jgi:hypothetical protein
MDLVAEYQRRVFERQVTVEHGQGTGFVSDRAFDNLAYAAEHTLIMGELISSEQYKSYMEWVAQGIVFYLRPHQELLREDGVRAGVTWDSVLRIDGMIKLMLEQSRIPYLPIESALMQERARAVDFVLKRLSGLQVVSPPLESSAPKIVTLPPRVTADARR